MDVDDQKVLIMTEKARRRTSKWDVEAEGYVETEIRIDNALPANDTSVNLTELNSTNPCLSMTLDDSEIDHSANNSGKVSDSNIIHSDVLCEIPQNTKQIDLEADCKDGFKKQDWEHSCQEPTRAESVENQFEKVLDHNIKHSDVLCEMPQDPKQIDLEGDCKDGFKKHVSQEKTMAVCVENQDKSLKTARELSPGPDERHQSIRSISPIDVRNISDRKRSRSRSRSRSLPYDSRSSSRNWSRTRSPSYVHRQGSERWTDTSRTSRMVSPCRDFVAGRCTRGGDCRFLHEGGALKQVDRYDSGSTDGTGSRNEKMNYSREKFPRRHDDSYGGVRDDNDPNRGYRSSNRCFNFTKGRCQRGTSCKYVHHDEASDGGWNARDESRARVSDIRGGSGNGSGASFSHGLSRPISQVPCKFFLENCCRNGERCKFFHPVKPVNIHMDSSVEPELRDQSTHFAPPLPLNGQMQQIVTSHPQNLQNQFPAFPQPQNSHYFNTSIQNQPVHPLRYEPNPQNPDSMGPIQQNLLMQPHNDSNYNLHRTIQQNFPPIHNAQGQPDFNVGVQIQQNVTSHVGRSHIPDVQNHLVALPPNPQIFNLDDKKRQSTAENNKTSAQQHILLQGADSSEPKPSHINSDDPITNKIVTSEQAAKIVDLSASLAQYFGTAALNSQSTTGMTPQPFLNPGSFVTTAAPLPTEAEGSQTNLTRSTPLEERLRIQQIDASTAREVKKTEAPQANKQQFAQLPNDDEAGKKNGDSKKIKEAKDIRMFKCALIEFVKDLLKPKWKEGQLSKEAHKTIVKKVVEKVSGSLQGPNVPQTQEKVDMYLLASKPKLSKLVQAYVEKFVKM